MKNLSIATAGVALLAIGAVAPAQAATIVAPNNLASTEGNSSSAFPFDLGASSSQRYQQVFAASEFASLSGPQLLTQIAFRPDTIFGTAFSSTISNVEINLSTTNKTPDGLSTAFADNIGADNTTVFNGPLSLSSVDTGAEVGPKDFDIAINLPNPFLYNPAQGNLLLDVKNFTGESTTPFDAEFSLGDPVSRVFATGRDGVNASSGSADALGLVVQFTTTPTSVPEPTSVLGVLTFGALGAGSWLLRKQKKMKQSGRSLHILRFFCP